MAIGVMILGQATAVTRKMRKAAIHSHHDRVSGGTRDATVTPGAAATTRHVPQDCHVGVGSYRDGPEHDVDPGEEEGRREEVRHDPAEEPHVQEAPRRVREFAVGQPWSSAVLRPCSPPMDDRFDEVAEDLLVTPVVDVGLAREQIAAERELVPGGVGRFGAFVLEDGIPLIVLDPLAGRFHPVGDRVAVVVIIPPLDPLLVGYRASIGRQASRLRPRPSRSDRPSRVRARGSYAPRSASRWSSGL